MPQIDFKFNINNKVKTILGHSGVVRGLGYDERGNQYDIVTKNGNAWYKEKELKKDKKC